MVIEEFAGHFIGGGSDKVWDISYDDTGLVTTRWGATGANLQQKTSQLTSLAAASLFRKKVSEKQREGYQQISFDSVSPPQPGQAKANLTLPGQATDPLNPYLTSHVSAVSRTELLKLIKSGYALQEKVNGERTVLVYDGKELSAYNRNGKLQLTIPKAALALTQLNTPFVLDGERMLGESAGSYIIFDCISWNNADQKDCPFVQRLAGVTSALRTSLPAVELNAIYTPSASAKLVLLLPTYGRGASLALLQIEATGGEGVIIREPQASYEVGNTKTVLKYKFRTDIDCVVVGIKPGVSTGSATLALRRPSDNAWLKVGNVRSGLTDNDLVALGRMLANGQQPILKVEYLPIRTKGIQLVEPTTSMLWLRTDKNGWDCTTDQFPPNKTALIATTKPWLGSGHSS